MSPSKGFTLVELLIVIALVSIIGGIGAPNLLEWNCKQTIKKDFTNLSSAVFFAHGRAVDQNNSTRLHGSYNSGTQTMTYRFYNAPTAKAQKVACGSSVGQTWQPTTDAPVVLTNALRSVYPNYACFHADGTVTGDETSDQIFQWDIGRTCGAKVIDYRIKMYQETGFMEKLVKSRQQNKWLEF